MKQHVKVGIIGAGHIGSTLYNKVKANGWEIKAVLKDDGIYKDMSEKIDNLENYQNYLSGLDIGFLAIPTFDDGKTAFGYMHFLLDQNIPVVTCEKGALSNYFPELEKWLPKIGYSATVGGGTRLLRYLEERIGQNIEEIHAVLNGTLNYIFDEVSRGRSLGEVVEETRKLGYAEPGANDPLEIINKEATGDIPMKSSILFNLCRFTSKPIRAKDIKVQKIKEHELASLIQEASNRRFIVSITRKDNDKKIIGGFKHGVDDWIISAGFKHIAENPLYSQLVPSGVNNALLICEGEYGKDGTYRLTGQGAGSGPTTASMIKDAIHLIEKQKE